MIAYLIRHPTAANLIMLTFIFFGLKAMPDLKRETFPEFSSDYISVKVAQPGAAPLDIERGLCLRLEEAVDGLGSVTETQCNALEGFARMTLKLADGADMGRNLLDVQTRVDSIQDFPEQAESAIVEQVELNIPVVDLAISAPLDTVALKALAEQVKRDIKERTGIRQIVISGFSDHQYRIELRLEALRRLGMSVNDLAERLARQSVQLPTGVLETAQRDILLRVDQRSFTRDELANIVVRSSQEGGLIKLGDIADVIDGFSDDSHQIRFDGQNSAKLTILKNRDDDSLKIKDELVHFVENYRHELPRSVTLTLTNDLSSLLWDRLIMLIENGWQGVLLVFLCMWLFFEFKYAFWVAMGLPVAFLGGLFLMVQTGLTINIMTLVAFLMAIGIMMDDAIVIAESIASHIERGLSRSEALVTGVKKVMPGVLSSFLTTVFIFSSIAFLQGDLGRVLRVVPQTLILVLTVSLVEAFFILPNHLSHSLARDARPLPAFKRRFLAAFDHFRQQTLVAMVEWVMRWRYPFLGGVVSLLLLSISLLNAGVVKFMAFPDLEGDLLSARLIMVPGTPLAETERVTQRLIASARALDEKFSQQETNGRYIQHITEQFGVNPDAGESGPHVATVTLDLLGAELRHHSLEAFRSRWEAEVGPIPGALALVFKQPAMGPAGRAIDIRIRHDNLTVLSQVSQQVQLYLMQINGISGLMDNLRPGKPEIVIKLKPGAEAFNVDALLIASQLRSAYFYQTADEIQIGPENIRVDVKLARPNATRLEALANFPITVASGKQLPLSAVADLDWQRNYVQIARLDGQRYVNVTAEVNTSLVNTAEVMSQLTAHLLPQLLVDNPGLQVDLEGQVKESAKTAQSLRSGFMLGLFGVFVILSIQFRSYIEPLVVMLVIPLALIGVVFGHWLLGYNLSMPSMMGYVALAGVVVNDSILLVQYIRHHVALGVSVHQSVVLASQERFRAILITSVTTAAGMLPLLLETSLQAQVLQPLVISMVFGIFASTCLVLLLVPACYGVLEDLGWVSFSPTGKGTRPDLS
jgi:multidrug efflux pump subunit AcrB